MAASGGGQASGGRQSGYRFSSFELLLLAMFGALVVAANVALRLPIKMPGRSGLVWMAILIVARSSVRRPGAGVAAGAVSGLMAGLLGMGDHGALDTVLSYTAAGAGVDLVASVAGPAPGPAWCALAGATGNLAKLGVKVLLEIWIGIPAGFVLLGRSFAVATHLVFGLLGGAFGFAVVRSLERAGYFAYLAGRR
jgi:hypothetical protein